jgi:hypothetical protein
MAGYVAAAMVLWVAALLVLTPRRLRHHAKTAWISVAVLTVFSTLWAVVGYLAMTVACFIAMGVASLWAIAAERANRNFWRKQRPWNEAVE